MLNAIWLGLILTAVFVAGLLGRITGPVSVADSAFTMAKASITLALGLIGGMMLWLGMLRIAEKAGLVAAIARAIRPLMTRLFPEVPPEHPAMGSMILNMAANLLGLGNAATPLGLKAMQELDRLNPHPGTATNAMATFLAINTSSVTVIPATALIYLSAAGVPDPHAIVVPSILATTCSTLVAVLAVRAYQRFPAFAVRPEPAPAPAPDASAAPPQERSLSLPARIGLALAGAMVLSTVTLELRPDWRDHVLGATGLGELVARQEAERAAGLAVGERATALEAAEKATRPEGWRGVLVSVSALVIPCLFAGFTVVAAARGVRVYEEFVDGAREGWDVAKRIMPFLVAILVAMGMFRDSGALTLLQWAVSPVLDLVGFPSDLLPLALMRPLSGSGSSGLLAELLARPDLPVVLKYTAGTMFGSTETTFYVLAVYFGSVSIRRTRHALAAGLTADLAGMTAAVLVCRMMFG
jgi:spore maturation protein SpmA